MTGREELVERRFIDVHHGDATTVALGQRVDGVVAGPHADAFGEDQLELRRRAASYHCPDQRQRVVVEVRLQHSTRGRAPPQRRVRGSDRLSQVPTAQFTPSDGSDATRQFCRVGSRCVN